MARNKKLELNNVASGVWFTTDGRFAVVRRRQPINPMEATVDFKITNEFSIRSFEGYDGPRNYPQLAPEVGSVSTFKEVFPWLGEYTGEGSFVVGEPMQAEPLPLGGRRLREAVEIRVQLLGEAQEFLTTEKIERMRKDFLVLMRNIKKLHEIRDIRENEIWRKAVIKWGLDFEGALDKVKQEIGDRLRAQSSGGDYVNEHDAKYLLSSMSDAWEFSSDMRSPPGDALASYRDQNDRDLARGRETGWWTDERILERFLGDLRSWERRTRAHSRKAWKWLNDMAQWSQRTGLNSGGGRAIVIGSTPQNVSIAGFQVQLKDSSDDAFGEKVVRGFERGLKWYRMRASKVYPEMLRNTMPFVLDFKARSAASASYEYDHIKVNPWGTIGKPSETGHVIAHEMGHRIWRTLSDAAQKRWALFIKGSHGDLDLRDVVGKWLGKEREFERRDPITYLRFETLVYDPRYRQLDIFSLKKAQEYLRAGGNPIFNVTLKPVTGYGAKDPEEAFCEALGLLVSYGPRAVLPEVKAVLMSVVPRLKLEDEEGDVGGELLAEEKWKLNKQWFGGIKKWWKGIVEKGKKFEDARGQKAGEEAIRYLEGARKSLMDLKKDMWLKKGLWPHTLSGDEKIDRKLTGNPVADVKNNIAHDFEEVDDVIYDKISRVKTWYKAIYDKNSMERNIHPGVENQLQFGRSGDKDALDAEMEGIIDTMRAADKIVSGKMFRRLAAFVNKWNPDDSQDDPLKDQGVDTEFSVGKMKVIVDFVPNDKYHVLTLAKYKKKTIDPGKMHWLVRAVTSAQAMLKRAGFDKVWYGTIRVHPSGDGYEFKGQGSGTTYRAAANYVIGKNTVNMFGIPAGGSQAEEAVRIIVHELGHRWYYKNMTKAERVRFDSYFGGWPIGKPGTPPGPVAVEPGTVRSVSSYGGENPAEDFAELFAWYVLGRKLSRDQRERFKQFALKGGKIKRHEGVERSDSMGLRRRSYIEEAKKKMTYGMAQGELLDMLNDNGWTVKANLKIPHASKDGVRIWLKPQAIYASSDQVAFGSARSMHLDPRKLATFPGEKVSGFLYRKGKEMADFLLSR